MTNPNPSQRATQWLDAFGAALAKGDLDATEALFEDDCYWRDLVSFTWNICTQEGKGAMRTMLESRLADVAPSDFALEGEASEAGGVIDAWFTFATRLSRGRGHLRLKTSDLCKAIYQLGILTSTFDTKKQHILSTLVAYIVAGHGCASQVFTHHSNLRNKFFLAQARQISF